MPNDSDRLVEREVVVEGDVRFVSVVPADSSDPHARELADGVYPASCRRLFSLLRELAPHGGRVLDVGGYVGGFGLAAAAQGYEVACVEASPANVAILEKAARLNGFDRMRVVHAAASDSDSTVGFLPNGPWGWVVSSDDQSEGVVSVPCVRLDGLLATLEWDTVDFVKLDVEGSELAALRGLGLAIDDRLPPIVFECNGHTLAHHRITPEALTTAFGRLGYLLYSVEDGILRPVEPGAYQPDCLVDYVATRGLPPHLTRHNVSAPFGRGEFKRRTLRSLRSANKAVRRYSIDALVRAPMWLQNDRAVLAQLLKLTRDPDESIRAAAEAAALTRSVSTTRQHVSDETGGRLQQLWTRLWRH